ncbi:hypothetical protein QVD17_25793 [Tagetes erecta]|uniref:Uncharacterized protein n=1 Tax=Tagetes erecta TaxID=13708 RepID=A0AAD8K7P6_TARER|nr:hypothetical protein QVD17_25793 [Tagetes erecta]
MVKDSEKVKVKEGGRIRIGATGKVSALMMQELDSNMKTSPKKHESKSQRIQTAAVSVDCGGSTRRLMSLNSGAPNMKQQIPMLDCEDMWVDKTPVRVRGKQQYKKVVTTTTRSIVETVDFKCGKNDGDWSMTPISNQLRRLSFSKISD